MAHLKTVTQGTRENVMKRAALSISCSVLQVYPETLLAIKLHLRHEDAYLTAGNHLPVDSLRD